MATNGNNISGKIAHARDSFFSESEKEYFTELLKDPKEKALHEQLLKEKAEKLYKKAMDLIERVERGEFNEEQMIKVERVIAHCLAAIEDLHMILELELTMDKEL